MKREEKRMEKTPNFLLNCPFCNGKAEMINLPPYHEFYVKCLKCKVEQGHIYRSKQSAMNAWNRRVKA